ncbi:hypothetical protein CFIMG_008570RA00001 [Ceratocystis fimbriata CBS 114723]|uniref:DUF1308 domain-containing protein n=1 Tax=Ceratocystis fimbriata CBS 114723 TaxID=1035309 RepID=A0A2C5X1I8_9PEZI|nr:hypothetical protein CFIMG_008570RA00001 [Ceratocystis fimbriata CBS 114723]
MQPKPSTDNKQSLISDLHALRNVVEATRSVGDTRPLHNVLPGLTSFISKAENAADDLVFNMSLIWAAIKKSRNLTGLKQTFMATTTTEIRTALRATGLSGSELVRQTNLEVEKSKVTVNAVVSKGVEWIKLINMNEQRLLFEMAANGWDFDSESESESESKDQSWPNSVNLTAEIKSTGNDRLSIVRHAKMLARASQSNPCRYRIPTVRIVLPRITAGKVKEIDKVLDMARNAGPNIILETAESDFVAGKSLSLGTVLSRLMVDESEDLTTTVNLDTSILVALMSDITHSSIPDQPWYSKATTQQIIDEQKDPGAMTRALYPALQGRDLVCTEAVANHMRVQMKIMGTPTQQARLDALFSGIDSLGLDPNPPERLAAFKALSSHVVPDDLRLPIKIVNFNIEQTFETGLIPEAARSVISELRDITCSTFTYGWISRTTTISCNKQLTSIVGRVVQQSNIGSGPIVWVCPVVRSLAPNGNHHRADKRSDLRKVREDKERLTQGEES